MSGCSSSVNFSSCFIYKDGMEQGVIQEALSLAVRSSGAKPCHSVSPFGSWWASSSHSKFPCGHSSAATIAGAPARSSSIRWYSPFFSVRSTVVSSNPMQSSVCRAVSPATCSLATRSPNAVTESVKMFTPLPQAWPCWVSAVPCNPEPLAIPEDESRFSDQSICLFRARNHGCPNARLYAFIRMTSTSGWSTGATWLKYWPEIVNIRLSLPCSITCPSRPRVVVCSFSCGSPSIGRSPGGMKMLIAPRSMSTRMGHMSQCWSPIISSWILCAESRVSVLQRYWLYMWALRLSRITLGFSAIR